MVLLEYCLSGEENKITPKNCVSQSKGEEMAFLQVNIQQMTNVVQAMLQQYISEKCYRVTRAV